MKASASARLNTVWKSAAILPHRARGAEGAAMGPRNGITTATPTRRLTSCRPEAAGSPDRRAAFEDRIDRAIQIGAEHQGEAPPTA